MNNEIPGWNAGDKLKSVRGVIGLGKTALADLLARVDTWLADRINDKEDEN